MLYTVPHYYTKFQCIASKCQDTCCAGWEIAIDKASLKRYETEGGAFGNRLKNSVDFKNASFLQYDGRCVFLNEDNLCDMHLEKGEKYLCRTCRIYPRHIEEFEGVRESSLCLSCIEAARLILGCKEPVHFLSKENEKEETFDDFDFFLYTKLTDARELLFQMLQDRTMAFSYRLSLALGLAHDLQRCLRQDKLYEADALFERASKKADASFCRQVFEKRGIQSEDCRLPEESKFPSRFEMGQNLFGLLDEMEPLREDWKGVYEELKKRLYGKGEDVYLENRRRFLESSVRESCEIWWEQLAVYFVFAYFCGAVYNENPYGKMKLSAASVLLLQEMAQALWQEKGDLTLSDMADISHRFSRELEHSDENKVRFEELLCRPGDFSLNAFLNAINC